MKPVELSVVINRPLGVEGSTRVTMRYEGDRGLLRPAGPLVAGIGRRQMEGDFLKLKQLLERAT